MPPVIVSPATKVPFTSDTIAKPCLTALALENEVTLAAVVPSAWNNSNVVVPLVFLTVNISSVVTATELDVVTIPIVALFES